MKKIFIFCLITTLISISFGLFIFINYKNNLDSVVFKEEDLYMILYGSYNDINKVNKIEIDNYILKNENGFYRVYIGVTNKYDNALKIKEIYKSKNIDTYILEKTFDSITFINYLDLVDNFDNKNDEEILELENEIINKYKEVFNE